ncbi:MAG: HlyC/CorC family transporter [Magnetococcales bacterium]|nr:HlyC/CorC family transporter [Magnetococcales bacterium]
MELAIQLIIMLIFLLLKGFYSGSEIAMVNCDKIKMRHWAKMGNKGAQRVLDLFETPDVILGTTLVGTNIATVTVSTMGALIFIDAFGSIGDPLAVIVMTPFLLILGEIVPKSVYQQKANEFAKVIIYPLRFSSLVFYPVIFIFSRVARFATRLVGGTADNENGITREGIRMILEMSESNPDLEQFDKERVGRIIRFADTTAGEAMIPLAEVIGVSEDDDIRHVLAEVLQYGYNRLPVYDTNITNITGILTMSTWDIMNKKDVLKKSLMNFVHEPYYISPRQMIDQVLPEMQKRDDHMAVVVDEFGSAIGILTLDDIFEEVVGDMTVGYDFEDLNPHKRQFDLQPQDEDGGAYLVDARVPVSRINESLYLQLPVGESHTLGGLIENKLCHIPKEGEFITTCDTRFTVKECDARSVKTILIERK